MTHQLKIWTGNFEAVAAGKKTHEIRTTKDRTFTAGDTVILREYVPHKVEETDEGQPVEVCTEGSYTGRQVMRKISYVSPGGAWGLPPDVCVFSMFGATESDELIQLDDLYCKYRSIQRVAVWGGSFEREHQAQQELKPAVNQLFDAMLKFLDKRTPHTAVGTRIHK